MFSRLHEPVSGAGLGLFRALFGVVVAVSSLRFVLKGWVEAIYLAPAFHFTWAGLDFVRPWPAPWMHVHMLVLAALGVWIALGWGARWACLLFAALFTWAELIEKAAYLNHYYLVSLLAVWLALLPSDRRFRLGRRRQTGQRVAQAAPSSGADDEHEAAPAESIPRFAYALLQAQASIVYFYAGVAKLNTDWLFRAEPLRTWLLRLGDVPLIGGVLASEPLAFAMTWAGAAFDLTIWLFMLNRRTRPWAFVVAIGFHAAVGILFPIGVFPFVMMLVLTVFFRPDWPDAVAQRLVARWHGAGLGKGNGETEPSAASPAAGNVVGRRAIDTEETAPSRSRAPRLMLAAGCGLLVLQLLVPLRHLLYPGPVNWTEEGFRFSWRVMLIEKTGLIEYRVVSRAADRETTVFPRAELSKLQFQMLTVNPDMIQDYAHRLAARFDELWSVDDTAVYADSFVSFNGRPAQRWIAPDVDLAAQPRGLRARQWILPLASEPTERPAR